MAVVVSQAARRCFAGCLSLFRIKNSTAIRENIEYAVSMKYSFFVPMQAAPQGSKNARIIRTKDPKKKDYVALYESSKKVKPYRQAVKKAAKAAGVKMQDGPISLTVVFVRTPKANMPKTYTPYVTTLPDIDKQLRSLFDGLTGVAYRDDGQVCHVDAAEIYPNDRFPEVGTHVLMRSGKDVPAWLGDHPPRKQPTF